MKVTIETLMSGYLIKRSGLDSLFSNKSLAFETKAAVLKWLEANL